MHKQRIAELRETLNWLVEHSAEVSNPHSFHIGRWGVRLGKPDPEARPADCGYGGCLVGHYLWRHPNPSLRIVFADGFPATLKLPVLLEVTDCGLANSDRLAIYFDLPRAVIQEMFLPGSERYATYDAGKWATDALSVLDSLTEEDRCENDRLVAQLADWEAL